jgi:hypothetical protein
MNQRARLNVVSIYCHASGNSESRFSTSVDATKPTKYTIFSTNILKAHVHAGTSSLQIFVFSWAKETMSLMKATSTIFVLKLSVSTVFSHYIFIFKERKQDWIQSMENRKKL